MDQLLAHPANRVTAARAGMTAALALVVLASPHAGSVPGAFVVVVVAAALVLDGVDGWLARRTGTVTAFGARFDMEVDAALVAVLAVAGSGELGAWVLLLGAARYLLGAAARLWPWLGEPVAATRWRKVVAVLQPVALAAALSEALPGALASVVVATAGVLLAVSFGTQVATLAAGRHGVRTARSLPWRALSRRLPS